MIKLEVISTAIGNYVHKGVPYFEKQNLKNKQTKV